MKRDLGCDARPGMQVVDIAQALVAKALVMAAQMQNKGRLALDSNSERLGRGGERMRRAGIHNIERKHVGDSWGTKRRRKFDRVVIDVPCSGSGTWRRQVDARWRCNLKTLPAIVCRRICLTKHELWLSQVEESRT